MARVDEPISLRYRFGAARVTASPGRGTCSRDEGSAMNCSGTRFLHTNDQGSVVAVANCWGGPIGVNSYDGAEGVPQEQYGIPASTNMGRFGYSGGSRPCGARARHDTQAWIPELGMYYYKARMYSPTLGRFMQTDPIGYADGMNWYAYVGNDPVNFVDPTGESSAPPNPNYPDDPRDDINNQFRDRKYCSAGEDPMWGECAPNPALGSDIVVTASSRGNRAIGGSGARSGFAVNLNFSRVTDYADASRGETNDDILVWGLRQSRGGGGRSAAPSTARRVCLLLLTFDPTDPTLVAQVVTDFGPAYATGVFGDRAGGAIARNRVARSGVYGGNARIIRGGARVGRVVGVVAGAAASYYFGDDIRSAAARAGNFTCSLVGA